MLSHHLATTANKGTEKMLAELELHKSVVQQTKDAPSAISNCHGKKIRSYSEDSLTDSRVTGAKPATLTLKADWDREVG